MGTARRVVRQRGPALWAALATLVLLGAAAVWYAASRGPSVQVGDVVIRPDAPIDQERTYRLVLWEENVVLSGAGTTYRSMLEERVRAFQRNYPGVAVHMELFPPGEAANRLQAALAAGRPPDVYGSLTPRLYDRSYQIPVEAFLPRRSGSEDHPFLPSAWQALSAGGHVWGWPRWVRFSTWIGRRELLAAAGLDVDRAAREGWTLDEALSSLARVGGGRIPGLLVHPSEPELLRGLLAGAGHGPMLDGGTLAWSTDALAQVASFLLAAREQARMPRALDAAARERVARFARGQVGVIAPVRPELATYLIRTVPREALVLLPPPRPAGSALHVPAEVAAYLVFRQSPYAGDAHTRLAMELARFLVQSKDAWVSAQFPGVPAFTGDLPLWQGEAPWTEEASRALLQWADAAVYPSLDPAEAAVNAQIDDQVLAPALSDLWENADAAAWAERLRQSMLERLPEPGG